jgi:hypothetical protein
MEVESYNVEEALVTMVEEATCSCMGVGTAGMAVVELRGCSEVGSCSSMGVVNTCGLVLDC